MLYYIARITWFMYSKHAAIELTLQICIPCVVYAYKIIGKRLN